MEYIQTRYGFSASRTVAAGDSGNDVLMMSGAHPAIVVANAQPDLMHWLQSEDGQHGLRTSRIVVASKHEALGVLEGLQKLGFA